MSDFGTAWRDRRIAELEAQVQAQAATIAKMREVLEISKGYVHCEDEQGCNPFKPCKCGAAETEKEITLCLSAPVSTYERRVAALEKVYEATKKCPRVAGPCPPDGDDTCQGYICHIREAVKAVEELEKLK